MAPFFAAGGKRADVSKESPKTFGCPLALSASGSQGTVSVWQQRSKRLSSTCRRPVTQPAACDWLRVQSFGDTSGPRQCHGLPEDVRSQTFD